MYNQVIAEGCHENGIGIVKINDVEEAEEFGLTEMPVVVLFENQVPTLFTGDIEDEDEVLVRQLLMLLLLFRLLLSLLWIIWQTLAARNLEILVVLDIKFLKNLITLMSWLPRETVVLELKNKPIMYRNG